MLRITSLSCAFIIFCLVNLIVILPGKTYAQLNVKDSVISMHLIQAHYAYQIPGGDIASRFGPSSMVGGGYMYKTSENWLFGIEGGFMFGTEVKDPDNILNNIETQDGNIVDLEGIYSTYHFNERGYLFIAKAGKVISFGKPNPNSGILFGLGGGYLEHKIFIDHRDKSAPQITGDYLKGYDELKRGPAINAFAGFLFLDNKRVINFYTGIDLTMAFTQHVRPYSFSQMKFNNGKFTDILFSLKAGWFIPVYKRTPKEFYYY